VVPGTEELVAHVDGDATTGLEDPHADFMLTLELAGVVLLHADLPGVPVVLDAPEGGDVRLS